MIENTLANEIAQTWQALKACEKDGNSWKDKWQEKLSQLLELLPHGSGIDNGVSIDADRTTPEKLVFTFGYHKMDENGYYCGWDDYRITVTASLVFGLIIKIFCTCKGSESRDREGDKDYLCDIMSYAMHQEIRSEYDPKTESYTIEVIA